MAALTKEERKTIKDAAVAEGATKQGARYLMELAAARRTGQTETIVQLDNWAQNSYPKAYEAITRIMERDLNGALFKDRQKCLL
ncbi:MAG: hypothetical protein LBT81_01665 [Helicobacteraceae bacterium]|jgi:hypothetical protein|nr:hypothetical protein [Helicobacteraceae bacterium]